MLEELDRVSGYRDSRVVWKGGHGNQMSGAGPDINNLSLSIDGDDDCNFDGAIGGEFVQRVRVKRK